MRLHAATAAAALALLAAGCKAPDPMADLDVQGVETYYAIDSSSGGTTYLAPVVRFRIHNKTAHASHSIQATANFRRADEDSQNWGSDWRQVVPAGSPLQPGQTVLVVLKSNSRYYSTGPPEAFFKHNLFRDFKVEAFIREGSSPWTPVARAPIERRIGTRELEEGTTASPAPAASSSPSAAPTTKP